MSEETAEMEDMVEGDELQSLNLKVEIENIGPCKKHVAVVVDRGDIDRLRVAAVEELSESAEVPGFRVGYVPAKLVEKRFRKEISNQLKQKLLMQSLEQVSEENNLDAINEPNIDIETLEIPDEGDFEYEFDIEVRPDFELPDYNGLKIQRPTREITDADVDGYLKEYLSRYGQLVPTDDAARAGDYIVADLSFDYEGKTIKKLREQTLAIRPELRFQDARLADFESFIVGAKADETRTTELTISTEAESLEMRGEVVKLSIEVLDVKKLKLPELDEDFLDQLNVESEEDLRRQIRETLERQVTYQLRQSTRQQVLDKITESADWDLPEGLVRKQVENALRREILEMRQAGFSSEEISARENEMRQQSLTTTRQALKEHFVLDKIATKEEIEVSPEEMEIEIQLMAMQSGENIRKVRARLSKSGMIENLEAQIRERKAVDVILQSAEYEDVPMETPVTGTVTSVSQAICGMATSEYEDEDEDEDEDDTDE